MRFGNLAVFLLLLLAATGIGLMFHYRPAIGSAYLDVVDLREVSGFGFLRSLHRWGAYAVVIVVWLHLLRAALRGTYAPPRRHNWSVGVVLMVLTLSLAATGYLLPWDQHAYWGIARMAPAGEARIDDRALLHAYVWHCLALPLLAAALTFYHLRRARRDGAVAATEVHETDGASFR